MLGIHADLEESESVDNPPGLHISQTPATGFVYLAAVFTHATECGAWVPTSGDCETQHIERDLRLAAMEICIACCDGQQELPEYSLVRLLDVDVTKNEVEKQYKQSDKLLLRHCCYATLLVCFVDFEATRCNSAILCPIVVCVMKDL